MPLAHGPFVLPWAHRGLEVLTRLLLTWWSHRQSFWVFQWGQQCHLLLHPVLLGTPPVAPGLLIRPGRPALYRSLPSYLGVVPLSATWGSAGLRMVAPLLKWKQYGPGPGCTTKDPDILQHLSEVHLQNPMSREDPKWRSVGASGTGTSGQVNTVEEVELDLTYPQEASFQHHTPSPDLEPAGEEEERPASQQLEARHWSRAEQQGTNHRA